MDYEFAACSYYLWLREFMPSQRKDLFFSFQLQSQVVKPEGLIKAGLN